MRLFWIIVAASCAVAAVVFVSRQRPDAAFVMAALAGVAWFLHYRVQMKKVLAERDGQGRIGEDEQDDVDS